MVHTAEFFDMHVVTAILSDVSRTCHLDVQINTGTKFLLESIGHL